MRGPVPKRSENRRRRNEQDGPPPKGGPGATTAAWAEYAAGLGIDVPDGAGRDDIQTLVGEHVADGDDFHPLASEWLASLRQSGQAAYYEPSDWSTAKVLAHILSEALTAGRLTASLIERWQSGATELLTTEGARRRARVELEAVNEDGEDAAAVASVSELDRFRNRASASG